MDRGFSVNCEGSQTKLTTKEIGLIRLNQKRYKNITLKRSIFIQNYAIYLLKCDSSIRMILHKWTFNNGIETLSSIPSHRNNPYSNDKSYLINCY